MAVPFFVPQIFEEEIEAVVDVLRSGWLTTGPQAAAFEAEMAEFLGGDCEAIAVNSATAGLHLALEALGIGPSDSVLVPTLTFTATAEVVRYLGAEVILVDVDPVTLNIDFDDAERRIKPNTKAIMPVHFGGLPVDPNRLRAFAQSWNLKIVDDAAHALPAAYQDQLVGNWDTDATVFSFYANKTITTGEGGMVVTKNKEMAKRIRLMRTHGMSRDAFDRFTRSGAPWDYDVVAPGFKYNLTDMAAAIGRVQLRKAKIFREGRQKVADWYREKLSNYPIILPQDTKAGSTHSWHLFPIQLTNECKISRDEVIRTLTEAQIGTSVHYRPLHQMQYWKAIGIYGQQTFFPVADNYFSRTLSLPIFPNMTEKQCEEVCSALKKGII